MLAVGALAPRELATPGRELRGVHQAMEYLPQGNHVQAGDIAAPDIDAAGKHVIIIGGGDTAADCLGTANRQGALSVTVLDHNPAPASPRRAGQPDLAVGARARAAARRPTTRACTRRGRARCVEFVGDEDGAVRAVVVEEVEIVRVDGRREFLPVPESRTELPADLVLLAAGFVGTDVPDLLAALGVGRRPGARHGGGRRRLADLGAGRLLVR